MDYYDGYENEDSYGDDDVPPVDYYDSSYEDNGTGGYAEPLPESSRPRRDGPGGD